ncbi:MAG: hypothetical protein WCG85_10015 [Polyangia bacterium]
MNQSKAQDRVRSTSGARVAFVATLAVVLACAASARAQSDEESSAPVKNTGDAGLVLAYPASLQTGMSAGVGAGFMRAATRGAWLAWGARASWSTATEFSPAPTYSVTDEEIRLRLCGQLQRAVGRGLFGLRVGLGGTLVYEDRTLVQGARAGLPASQQEITSWAMLPAADFEGIVVLRVWDSWGMSVSGGPTLHGLHGSVRTGWTSGLGVTWQH